MKSQRTALEFVKEFGGKQVDGIPNLYIRSEADFRSYVNSLWPAKDPFKRARAGGAKVSDDEARCWRRKKLLLTEKWEGKAFTPADLAKTRHIVKLAVSSLKPSFRICPKINSHRSLSITGAVTATFRDNGNAPTSYKVHPRLRLKLRICPNKFNSGSFASTAKSGACAH